MRQSIGIESAADQLLRALRALGGDATPGDLLAVTGLDRSELERSLDALIGSDRAHVRVLDGGDLVIHLPDPLARRSDPDGAQRRVARSRRRWALARARRTMFDRRTLRLIRSKEGVLSLAELVEQTGLPLYQAEDEMRRLAESWGGEPHVGLDGHQVFAFPELMSSLHDGLASREPRPAWAIEDDPMDHARVRTRRTRVGVTAIAAGAVTLGSAPLWAAAPAGIAGAMAAGVALTGVAFVALGIREVLRHARRFRFRQPDTLRRYALGHVIETALGGKGIVSLERTVRFIQGRAGPTRVSRKAVEKALRQLALEFDAPITDQGGDLFFGFRNVKRQFLASLLLRRQLALGGTVSGDTVFDTGDPPELASARELEVFDRELGVPDPAIPRR